MRLSSHPAGLGSRYRDVSSWESNIIQLVSVRQRLLFCNSATIHGEFSAELRKAESVCENKQCLANSFSAANGDKLHYCTANELSQYLSPVLQIRASVEADTSFATTINDCSWLTRPITTCRHSAAIENSIVVVATNGAHLSHDGLAWIRWKL